MVTYNNEPIIKRLIRQITTYGTTDITVVVGYKRMDIINKIGGVKFAYNERYKDDVNNYSMLIGLNDTNDDVVVFESDIIVEDEFIKYVFGTDFENKSVWYVDGKLKEGRSGGIVKTDGKGNVTDINIIGEYNKEYSKWYKMTGVMRISKDHVKLFHSFLRNHVSDSCYFHYIWKENMNRLKSIIGDCSHYEFSTFNTFYEYQNAINKQYGKKPMICNVELEYIDNLFPIEKIDIERLPIVRNSLVKDNRWFTPLKIDSNSNIIFDGHHSFEIAKILSLSNIPVIKFDYDDIDMWSLREEIDLSKDIVMKNARKGLLYPYKTVKHKFPLLIYTCNYSLDELRGV